MRVSETGAPPRRRAAYNPPKPPPIITTRCADAIAYGMHRRGEMILRVGAAKECRRSTGQEACPTRLRPIGARKTPAARPPALPVGVAEPEKCRNSSRRLKVGGSQDWLPRSAAEPQTM